MTDDDERREPASHPREDDRNEGPVGSPVPDPERTDADADDVPEAD